MSNSQDEPKTDPRQKKKRRWLRILLILFVLFIALGLAVNGPIARWLVGKVLTEQLAKQGLRGTIKVNGRLWSGFTLKEAEFSGGDSIARIKFGEVGVHYSLFELRDKKIRRLHGNGLELEINLKEKEEKTEKTEPQFHKIAGTLRQIRPLVLPVELDLQRFEVTLNRPDKEPLHISFGALVHDAGSPTFELRELVSNALGEEGLPRQDLVLTWRENDLHLGAVQVLPELALKEASIDYPASGPIALAASVRAAAADLELTADESGTIELTMENGPLEVGKIVAAYKPDLRLDGTISRLQVTARNLWEDPDKWTARLDLDGTDLKWPERGELSALSLRLTADQDLQLTASAGTDLQLEVSAPRPELKDRELAEVWKNLPVIVKATTPSLHQTLRDAFAGMGKEVIELAKLPEGALTIEGELTSGGEMGVSPAALRWTFADLIYQEKSLPNLQGTARLADGVAHLTATLAQPRPEETLTLAGSWNLEAKSYQGELTLQLPDLAWVNPFIPGEGPDWRPTGPLAVTWKGSGTLPTDADPTHAGTLEVGKLTVTAPEDTTTAIAVKGSYDWPGTIDLASLSLRNEDLWLEGAVKWTGDRFTIDTLRLHDQTGPLAHLDGSLPLSTKTLAPKVFFEQEEKIALTLEATELRLKRLANLVPLNLPEGFAANLNAVLRVGGTPANPLLSGIFKASEVDTPGPEKLPLLAAEFKFSTANRILKAQGEVTEPGGRLVSLEASLPLQINRLLNDPEEFKKLPIQARATIKEVALQRLQILAPPLAQAEGTIEADFRVAGTANSPVLSGGAAIKLKRYPLPGTPFRDIRDSALVVRLDGSQLVVEPSTINCAGGKIVLRGTAGMRDGEPEFALRLDADHILAWRNDSFIMRANAGLKLDGRLSAAQISGEIEFVESLFYKDIDILPIGVPTASVPKPQLPKIDQEQAAKIEGGIPAPFGAWTLNVAVRTGDPILIRGGNFATGRVTANARVTGTLASPKPTGTVAIEDAWARLPLSGKLHLKTGIITLRPDAPYDPTLNLEGTANVDRHNISLKIFGSANNPKYYLSSEPPLPESEILTLLATGTTTGDLEDLDKDAATMKAAQFAINWAKDRFQKPGRDTLFQNFLTQVDDVQLNVGENDPFSGRKFNSATLELTDKFFLSAAVDATGNTRGVVIFSVRFR